MKPKILLFGLAILAIILVAAFFLWPKKPIVPDNLLKLDAARQIVQQILKDDPEGEDVVAYLWPQILKKGDQVSSWDYEQSAESVGYQQKIDQFSWLAWIDREPGNAFFAHETEFVYINGFDGTVKKIADNFWPVINEESFEGDETTMVTLATPQEQSNVWQNLKNKLWAQITQNIFSQVQAAGASHVRITANEKNAPKGEYYALVVSGFGKNSWVFLDGTKAMYEALKKVGYDDGHITYLAQGPAMLDPAWNKQGTPKLIKNNAVDGPTSPEDVSAAIKNITSKMKAEDSLFVFILSHGERDYLALGKPAGKQGQNEVETALYGRSANLYSKNFSAGLLKDTTACEIMVVFDSCYSGSQEKALRASYDEKKIKRLAVAHSTNDSTKSYGADYRLPVDLTKKVKASLDEKAAKTPVADLNPADFGGEFSSGLISNLNKTIFSVIYDAGESLDAAKTNKMTKPYMWTLGKDGLCTTPGIPDTTVNPPKDIPKVTPPPEEKPIPSTTVTPKKKIKVVVYGNDYIPYDQLKVWTATACPCCNADHYHAKNGTNITTVANKVITDPFADCGYGKVSDLIVKEIEI